MEGATYVRQSDHQVGHWPTFLVIVEQHCRTVDDAKYPPEQEDDDDGERFFALGACDSLHELHEVKSERRHDDCTVEHLTTTQPTNTRVSESVSE